MTGFGSFTPVFQCSLALCRGSLSTVRGYYAIARSFRRCLQPQPLSTAMLHADDPAQLQHSTDFAARRLTSTSSSASPKPLVGDSTHQTTPPSPTPSAKQWLFAEFECLRPLKQHIDLLTADYEKLRHRYLRSRVRGTVSVLIGDHRFNINFKTDPTDGTALVDRMDVCKALISDGSSWTRHWDLMHHWNRSLVNSNRRSCFRSGNCASDNAIDAADVKALVTEFGLQILLSRQIKRKPDLVSCLRSALIEEGILSPFVELAFSEKPEETLNEILALVREKYPGLTFIKQKVIHIKSGHATRRYLDLWCEELKLNVECNENDHNHPYYSADYESTRAEDIESTSGSDVHFYSYDPQANDFDEQTEAAKICELISVLMKKQPDSEASHREVKATLNVIGKDGNAVPAFIANRGDPQAPEEAVDDCKAIAAQLMQLRREISAKHELYEEMRQDCIRKCKGKSGAIPVRIGGSNYVIIHKIIESESGESRPVFFRQSVCQALAENKDNSATISNNFMVWHRGQYKSDPKEYFAKLPVEIPRKGKQFKPGTVWLTERGLAAMLGYSRFSKPTSVKAIQKSLVAAGLWNPFHELPFPISVETETTRDITLILKERYPNLKFVRKSVSIKNGSAPIRKLDLWCADLKLNIQCQEKSRRKHACLTPEYMKAREDDIKQLMGDDTKFYYYDPLAEGFDVGNEADKILEFIAGIIADNVVVEPGVINNSSGRNAVSVNVESSVQILAKGACGSGVVGLGIQTAREGLSKANQEVSHAKDNNKTHAEAQINVEVHECLSRAAEFGM